MGLTVQDRGMLETIIDKIIARVKGEKTLILDPKTKEVVHLRTPEDFLFGMCYGELLNSFSGYFSTVNRRLPDPAEIQEVTDIVLKRLPEFRNAIYFVE